MATATKVKNIATNANRERSVGKVAKTIEAQTARLPSDTFLWAAVGAMACSLTLKLLKNDHMALFIGQWPAPFLLFGIYNKLVKQLGHDQQEPYPQDGQPA